MTPGGDEIADAHPARRAHVPPGGTQRFLCFLVVMREQARVLVQSLSFGGGNGRRDRRVSCPPRRTELHVQRDLVCQRMLERVFRYRVDRTLVHELRRKERRQRRVELVPSDLHHRLEQRARELLADHRRRVQHLLLPIAEPIDPRREQRLHRRRHLDGALRRRELVRPPRADEATRLDQRYRYPIVVVRESGNSGHAFRTFPACMAAERRGGLPRATSGRR